MKHTENLFELIQALSKTEKRYFKRFTTLHVHGEKNRYILLFDAIAKQKKYNEAELKKQFRNEGFTRQFPVAKNYLYNLILKTLRSYHHSIHSEIKDLIRSAEILYEKGLSGQSHKIILQAKQVARRHEMHHAMTEIFRHWEMNLALRNADVSWMRNILREETEEISLLQNTKEYRTIYFQAIFYLYLHGAARDKKHLGQIKKMIRSPLLSDESKAKTFSAKLHFHEARGHCFGIMNDRINQYLSVKNTIAHFKKHPERIRQGVSSFIIRLNNMLDVCTINQKYSEMPVYLREFDLLVTLAKTSDEKTKLFYFTAVGHLNYYVVTGRFSDAVSYMAELNRQIDRYESSLNNLEKALLFHNISLSYFGAGEYKSCIHWLNRIRNEVSLNVRPDFEGSIRLFYLIAQYEAGNMDLLPSLIRSAYRHLKQKQQLYKFEAILIDFFRNELPKTNIKEELLRAFLELKDKVAPLESDDYEKSPFEFFDYISWLESKVENRTFAEAVKEKAEKILKEEYSP